MYQINNAVGISASSGHKGTDTFSHTLQGEELEDTQQRYMYECTMILRIVTSVLKYDCARDEASHDYNNIIVSFGAQKTGRVKLEYKPELGTVLTKEHDHPQSCPNVQSS